MLRLAVPHYILFTILLLASCSYALWKGGAPERIGAAIFLAAAALTHVSGPTGPLRWTSVETGIFAVDVAALVALGVLALRAERFWPLWVTALQAIGTAGHAVKWADPEVIRWGYAFALAFWSYPMLAVLAIGTYCHRRRLARHGADSSWSSSSPLSVPPRRSGPIN